MFLSVETLKNIINNPINAVELALAEATLAAFEAHQALDDMLRNNMNKQG